jgi:hypothetical protein
MSTPQCPNCGFLLTEPPALDELEEALDAESGILRVTGGPVREPERRMDSETVRGEIYRGH